MLKANRKAVAHARQQKIADLCDQLRLMASEQQRSIPHQPVDSGHQQLPAQATAPSEPPLDQPMDS